MTELIVNLQLRLDVHADAGKRRWWERYLRGEAAFRGVAMEDVRACVHAWVADFALTESLSDQQLLDLASGLIAQSVTEDKLAGVLLLQEILIPAERLLWSTSLPVFAGYFDSGRLADWNAVDWFCVKALHALTTRNGEECARSVLAWSDADNLWRARASVVTFANVSSRGSGVFDGFPEAVISACDDLIGRPERFAKTAVGWVLAGLGETEPARVAAFVDRRFDDFTRESLANAVKKLRPAVAAPFLARQAALPRQ